MQLKEIICLYGLNEAGSRNNLYFTKNGFTSCNLSKIAYFTIKLTFGLQQETRKTIQKQPIRLPYCGRLVSGNIGINVLNIVIILQLIQ